MGLSEYKLLAADLDQKDPLKNYRDLFVHTDAIYLDGNSLGKLPLLTSERNKTLVEDQWGKGLINSWSDHWLDLPNKISAKLAKLVGAQPEEILICDTTSINLYKLAFGALSLQKGRDEIITDDLNFPSDLYVFEGLIKNHFRQHRISKIKSDDEITINESTLIQSISSHTALISLSHVLFKSAFMYAMKSINDAAHRYGALTLWDLSHATGAVPVQLNAWGADMAVGCTYKYLNGGPGAPAFLYVRKDLQEKLVNPIWAWFSHQKPFDFNAKYTAPNTIHKFAISTPGILSMAPVETGIDVVLDAGIEKIRAKSIAQSEFFIKMIQNSLEPLGFKIASPLESTKRGSHISLQHEEGFRISQAMIYPKSNAVPIIPDFRPPNNIRLGIAPLYNSFYELYLTVERLEGIVKEKEYL